jgi:hypothetical protein
MFLEEDGDRYCLMCGERVYDWLSGFVDRLLEAMEHQARQEARRELRQEGRQETRPEMRREARREARHDHAHAASGDDPHRAER